MNKNIKLIQNGKPTKLLIAIIATLALIVILAAVLIFALNSSNTSKISEEFVYNDFRYSVSEDDCVKIVKYSNTQKKIIYEMPLFDFFMKVIVSYGTVLFMIAVTLLVWKDRRKSGDG